MANLTITKGQDKTPTGSRNLAPSTDLFFGPATFGTATEVETLVDVVPVGTYRSISVATRTTGTGTLTVVLKIYPCDSVGNATTNTFLTKTITAAGNTLDIIADMGGATTNVAYPPASATTGMVVVPISNWIRITEAITVFTSGTLSVTLELGLKG